MKKELVLRMFNKTFSGRIIQYPSVWKYFRVDGIIDIREDSEMVQVFGRFTDTNQKVTSLWIPFDTLVNNTKEGL